MAQGWVGACIRNTAEGNGSEEDRGIFTMLQFHAPAFSYNFPWHAGSHFPVVESTPWDGYSGNYDVKGKMPPQSLAMAPSYYAAISVHSYAAACEIIYTHVA